MRGPDPLARLWAAAERLRGKARGGYATFNEASAEYDELLSAIHATRRFPVAEIARVTELTPAMVRELRRRGS